MKGYGIKGYGIKGYGWKDKRGKDKGWKDKPWKDKRGKNWINERDKLIKCKMFERIYEQKVENRTDESRINNEWKIVQF